MTSMAIVTPSYAPDYELCRDLHASVLHWASGDVMHHIIVPRDDLELFAALRGPRCVVWPVDALLPAHIVRVPKANLWINLRRPWPPVRGWIMQQVVKLGAATQIDDDVLLFVDSDIEFVRPVSVKTYRQDDRLPLYRKPDAIGYSMSRHVMWHETARRLLDLPQKPPPLPDYIAAMNAWDRATALALLDRISEVSGRPWVDAVCGSVHLSEFILYGVYLEEVLGRTAAEMTDTLPCHNYWDPIPLDLASASRFMDALPERDVAVMISAKSRTPRAVRRAVLDEFRLQRNAPE
jgi:hypothetical protein